MNKRDNLIESVKLKFTSGNDIPIETARITRKEYKALLSLYDQGCDDVLECIEPPGFDIQKAYKMAKKMGLKTEFPL